MVYQLHHGTGVVHGDGVEARPTWSKVTLDFSNWDNSRHLRRSSISGSFVSTSMMVSRLNYTVQRTANPLRLLSMLQ
jgi:hypothetical protein